MAQIVRAILLARAVATSILGLRAIIRLSQEPAGAPLRAAQRTAVMAPMISSRRMSRWPIRDVLPSRALPPVESCRGTMPSQAAKSRPLPKFSSGGAKARIAIAQIGPMPGTLISRVSSSSCVAAARMALASSAIFASNHAICSRSNRPRSYGGGQPRIWILDGRDELADLRQAPRRNDALFGQMPAQRVDRLSALAHQEVAGAKDHGLRLLVFALDGDEAQRRPRRCLGDGLGIRCVVLLPLHMRLHVGRRDQSNLVP